MSILLKRYPPNTLFNFKLNVRKWRLALHFLSKSKNQTMCQKLNSLYSNNKQAIAINCLLTAPHVHSLAQ